MTYSNELMMMIFFFNRLASILFVRINYRGAPRTYILFAYTIYLSTCPPTYQPTCSCLPDYYMTVFTFQFIRVPIYFHDR